MKKLLAVSAAAVLITLALASTYDTKPSDSQLRVGQAAFGGYDQDAPGVRRLIRVQDLPPPHATPSVDNGPEPVARPSNAWPQAPAGFKVEEVLSGLEEPRVIVTAPNGDLFVAESHSDRVRLLRLDDNGKVVLNQVFATGLRQPFGIAFYPPGPNPSYIYIANTDSVVRFAYHNGDEQTKRRAEYLTGLPGGGHLRGGGHWTRDIVFSPDGKKMFVSVGSHSNNSDDAEEKDRADILEFNPDGSGKRIYASGIRNPVGITIDPNTGQLWTSVNERDELGDNVPPDYVTHVEDGGFYGWPWYYIGDHPDPKYKNVHPELRSKVIVPDVLVQAHSASLIMKFYDGRQFPKECDGDAFAAEHGSWNRSKRSGYKIIRVRMKDGKATGEYDDFVTGFTTSKGDVWGRPVGITVAKDGALLFTDDGSNSLWRVTYTGASERK